MRKIKFAVVVFVMFALLISPVMNVNGVIPDKNDSNRYIVELDDYSRFPNSHSLMLMSHANFKANLAMNYPDAFTLFEYDTGLSGFSVSCTPETAKQISSFEDVRSVTMVRYAYPHLFDSVVTTGADQVWNMRDGVGENITGKGTLVGIIDTGVHYGHPSLGGGFGKDYKVCVGYNFVDYSPDPYPLGSHSHGTHCAGIVAATGLPGVASGEETPTGIAPDAKIGAYNVFGSRGGAPMDAVMMALEQAFEDKCDVVNLSLGSEYVWADEPYCKLIDNLVDKGMVVVGSAGNEGRNSREDLPFQVSSPGGADYSISVAAMNDSGTTFFKYGDKSELVRYMSFSEEVEDELSGELVYCELGKEEDVEDLNLNGAVALVKRGDLTFYDKAKNVESKGAVACVVFNNKPGIFGGTLGEKGITIPVIAVSDEVGEELLEMTGEEVMLKYDERLGLMTDFSSPGPTNDYRLKPDMAAPGFQVNSTYMDESYTRMNGTSMAAPTVAGGAALVIQAHPDWSAHDVRSALINYAKPQVDLDGNPHPVLSQGTGRMHVPSSINAKALFKPTSVSGGWVTEPFDYTINIKNVGDTDLQLFVDKHIEGDELPLEFGKIDVPAGETFEYTFTLGEEAKDGENTGYLIFTDGKNTARVAYLYYYGTEPEVDYVSHINVKTPVFSPNDDDVLDYFRADISFNKPMGGIEYVILDEDREVEKILGYSYEYIAGGMWSFNWNGMSDYDLITDGKHYIEFYTLDFDLDPRDKYNWKRRDEFEFHVTTEPPVIELDSYEDLVINDDKLSISGAIHDFLMESKYLGKDAIENALLYSAADPRNPVPIDFDSDGMFTLDLDLMPGDNYFMIYVSNAGGLEAEAEIAITAASMMEIEIGKTLIIDGEDTNIKVTEIEDVPFVELEKLEDLPRQIGYEVEGKKIHFFVGSNSVWMKVGEPLMITDMGVKFCEAPVFVDNKIMIPMVDLLNGFGADFNEETQTYSLMWIAE